VADLFISYAREDKPRIALFVRALEEAGFSVWWDQNIPGGADFVADTERALSDAGACVVCWTAHSVSSRWVRDEAGLAAELGKLVPVQLGAERPPMGLRQYQTIDLSDWAEQSSSKGLATLVETLRNRIKTPKAAQPADDRSIAVLPFVNLSGDSTCQNFCDAVGADIIALLARNKDLRVLARGLSFAERRPGESVAETGRRLGVRYIVDGTIRRSPENARITVELVLSSTGQLLWSGQTEGRLDDVFVLQDEMARYVAGVIAPELGKFEQEAAARKNPESLTAWESAKRGEWHLYKLTAAGAEKAESWFRRAIDLDPSIAQGHAGLAQALIQLAFLGSREDRENRIAAAAAESAAALKVAPDYDYAHFVRARALSLSGLIDESLAESDAALAINPSYAYAYFSKACAQATRHETLAESIGNFDFAIGLCVQDPMLTYMHTMKAIACVGLGSLDAAALAARMSVRQHNATLLSFATLASILGLSDELIPAAAVMRSVHARKADYCCGDFENDCFFIADPALKSTLIEGARRAGLR